MRSEVNEKKLRVFQIIAAAVFSIAAVLFIVHLFTYVIKGSSILSIILYAIHGLLLVLSLGLFFKNRVMIVIGCIGICLYNLYYLIYAVANIKHLYFDAFLVFDFAEIFLYLFAFIVIAVLACRKNRNSVWGWTLLISGSVIGLMYILRLLGMVVVPFIQNFILESPEKVKKAFDFFEQMELDSDPEIGNVAEVSVFEALINDEGGINKYLEYIGPESLKAVRYMAQFYDVKPF